jgi:hypothetical protein
MSEMFARDLRAMRRDRAARLAGDPFLLERSFDDCLDRIATFDRSFDRALLLSCPVPDWPHRLKSFAKSVTVTDPGMLFAERAGGRQWNPDEKVADLGTFDLIISIGTLDTLNGLQQALRTTQQQLNSGGLLIGAISGGETLPLLRGIMAAVDRDFGAAFPRVHPRIEAAMLAPLLEQAGFVRPVVDVDRIRVSYSSFDRLVSDLRAMAATNVLAARSRRPLTRANLAVARNAFSLAASPTGKAEEIFEILHFAAWR